MLSGKIKLKTGAWVGFLVEVVIWMGLRVVAGGRGGGEVGVAWTSKARWLSLSGECD